MLEASNTTPVEENLHRSSLSQKVNEILDELTPRESEILKLRYGFDGDPMTLEEIGNKLGLSRERIRQIEKKAKNKLRTRFRTKALRDYLN